MHALTCMFGRRVRMRAGELSAQSPCCTCNSMLDVVPQVVQLTSVLPLSTISCMQRRAQMLEEQEKGGAVVEAGRGGGRPKRVTPKARKRKAEIQVWLKRKLGAVAHSFLSHCSRITVQVLA